MIETPPLYENLSAVENLEVRAKLLNIPKIRIDEVLKIVETPLGIFKDQGVKVKSLEGQDIDNFLNSIEQ